MTLVVLNILLALSAIGFAAAFGGTAERVGAVTIACMVLIAFIGQMILVRSYESIDPVGFSQDILAFISFSLIGIYTRRVWPLWAAAFQLLSVGAHFVRGFDLPVRPVVYIWMKSGPTWAVYILLIVGTLLHRRQRSLSDNVRSFPD
jgi:hypothetical protein